jgi:hypothetical protein
LLVGYLVNKQEFGEVGLRITPSELRLKEAEETVPDETERPHVGYSPSRYISVVIAHYFDTYLGPEELDLEAPSNLYTRVGDRDSGWWASRNWANRPSFLPACATP